MVKAQGGEERMKFVSRATPVTGEARPPALSGWKNNEDIK